MAVPKLIAQPPEECWLQARFAPAVLRPTVHAVGGQRCWVWSDV